MKLHKVILTLMVLVGLAQAEAKLTAELWGSEGNKRVELDQLIKKIDTVGYSTVAANKDIQVHYYNKFKEKTLEMISFYGLVNNLTYRYSYSSHELLFTTA